MDQHTSRPRDSATESAGGGGRTAAATQRVWDRLVRILHWALVLSVLTAWLTTKLPGATINMRCAHFSRVKCARPQSSLECDELGTSG